MGNNSLKAFLTGILGMLLVVIICIIEGIIVMWAWNYVMPYLFGLKVITYLQGFALCLLGSMIFKSNISTSSKKD